MEKQIFQTRGNVEIFSQKKIALFSSKETPTDIWPAAEALFRTLSELPLSLAGGWQAPLEKQLLRQAGLTGSTANYILYLARNLNEYRCPPTLTQLLEAGKLLIIAPETRQSRPSRRSIEQRDKLLFAQINRILFLYIQPGGRLEAYFNLLLQKKYHLFLLDHPVNAAYRVEGVVPVNEDNAGQLISGA